MDLGYGKMQGKDVRFSTHFLDLRRAWQAAAAVVLMMLSLRERFCVNLFRELKALLTFPLYHALDVPSL